jgi:hypothetical protein
LRLTYLNAHEEAGMRLLQLRVRGNRPRSAERCPT